MACMMYVHRCGVSQWSVQLCICQYICYQNMPPQYATPICHPNMPPQYATPLCRPNMPPTMPPHYAAPLCCSTMLLHYAVPLCFPTMQTHYAAPTTRNFAAVYLRVQAQPLLLPPPTHHIPSSLAASTRGSSQVLSRLILSGVVSKTGAAVDISSS